MSSHISNLRLALAVALFASVIFVPPWVAGIFAVVLCARWRAYEVIAAGIFLDFLWMPASVSFLSLEAIPFMTLIALALVIVFEPLRRQLLIGPGILK